MKSTEKDEELKTKTIKRNWMGCPMQTQGKVVKKIIKALKVNKKMSTEIEKDKLNMMIKICIF